MGQEIQAKTSGKNLAIITEPLYSTAVSGYPGRPIAVQEGAAGSIFRAVPGDACVRGGVFLASPNR